MNRQGSVRLDPDFGIGNWRCEHIYGYTAREVVGRPGWKVLPALLGNRADRVELLERHGAWVGPEAHPHKDGRIVLVNYAVRAVRKRGQLVGYIARHQPVAQTNDYKMLTDLFESSQLAGQTPRVTNGPVAQPTPYVAQSTGLGSTAVVSTANENPVGTRLRTAREQAGLSKRQLAKHAGVDRRAIIRWESGYYTPSPENLRRLIPFIGGTIESYLFGD